MIFNGVYLCLLLFLYFKCHSKMELDIKSSRLEKKWQLKWITFLVDFQKKICSGRHSVTENVNLPLSLIDKYPNFCWNWYTLSGRSIITLEFVKKHIDKPWDWRRLVKNPKFTLEWLDEFHDNIRLWGAYDICGSPNFDMSWVDKYPDKQWNSEDADIRRGYQKYMCKNPNLTIDWLRNHPDRDWWPDISCNPNITLEILLEFSDKNWDWQKLTVNPNLDITWFQQLPDKPWDMDVFYDLEMDSYHRYRNFNPGWTLAYPYPGDDMGYVLSCIIDHPQFELDWIDQYPQLEWDVMTFSYSSNIRDIVERYPDRRLYNYEHVSSNKHIDFEFFKAHQNENWYYGMEYHPVRGQSLSTNPNMTMEWIDAFPDKPWDWMYLSQTIKMDLTWFRKHLDKPWNWSWLSKNPSITLEWIDAFPDKNWWWGNFGLSSNPHLDFAIVHKYPNKDWDWTKLSYNENLSTDWLRKMPDLPWEWHYISYHKFEKEKKRFIQQHIQEAVKTIENWFLEVKYDPRYKYCRRTQNEKMKQLQFEN